MAYTINARALQVEQELKELYDLLKKYGGAVNYAYTLNDYELVLLFANIEETCNKISISRADLSAMLAEAKKI